MNSIKKEAKIKMKVVYAFKVIITTLLVIAFTVSVISCKEAHVVEEQGGEQQEEEKGEITIPSETKETQETTPETTVEEEVFEEIVNVPEIAGLKFDQATKTYIAEAGNPYGLEVGVEAGVYTKEAIKVNGEMEDAIGLKPAVIDYFQKEYIKNNDCFFPLIFNLNEIKGIEIEDANKANSDNLDYLGVKVPIGTKIYAPVSIKDTIYQTGGGWSLLTFFASGKKERIAVAVIDSDERYSLMDSKKETEDQGWAKIFDLKIGELVAQIDQKVSFSLNEKAYYGDYDFFYVIGVKGKKINAFDKLLAFDSKKVYILPNESTANVQNQS